MNEYPVMRQFSSINQESLRYVRQWAKKHNYGNSEYDEQAKELAERLGIELRVNSRKFGSMPWDNDGQKRWVFDLSLVRGKQSYNFKFGQSIAANFLEPTMYDVLACMTWYNPGSFEDFCASYGYNSDSISDFKTYNRVVDEWYEISRMFSPEEIELLREIN